MRRKWAQNLCKITALTYFHDSFSLLWSPLMYKCHQTSVLQSRSTWIAEPLILSWNCTTRSQLKVLHTYARLDVTLNMSPQDNSKVGKCFVLSRYYTCLSIVRARIAPERKGIPLLVTIKRDVYASTDAVQMHAALYRSVTCRTSTISPHLSLRISAICSLLEFLELPNRLVSSYPRALYLESCIRTLLFVCVDWRTSVSYSC